MRMRLFHKLFIAIALASLSSIVLFALTAHWYFNQNFIRYLNDARELHLTDVQERLTAHYAQRRDWLTFSQDQRAWRRLVHDTPRSVSNIDQAPTPPPAPRAHGRGHAHFTLYDSDRQIIAGKTPYAEAVRTLALAFDGHTVGWVGAPPLAKPAAARDVRFAERQIKVLSFGALLACVLSIIVAFFAARRLALPIRLIGSGARELAEGNFATRLPALGRDEIGQLAGDFNVLARSLQHAESARRRWFADISHELRTPLAIMRGEIEAVTDGIRANDEALLRSLQHETQRLEKFINDLYDLARSDIGTLEYVFTSCSPGAIVTQALNRFAHRFAESGLSYEYDLDSRLNILADSHRLAQLVENIFENCCRYASPPGPIQITLKREAAVAALTIEDSGPGIDEAHLEHMFEPLSRADESRSRAFGGSGLGLAICKRIVVAHGGSIEASHSPRGGLTLTIHLPCTEHL